MSDRFQPIPMEQLVDWIFDELAARDSIFGVPRALFFRPSPADRFRTSVYGHALETPFGVAAGPHSQLAQNIVVAWLCGARFIELKTVQTLDELDISKPCIDIHDEGYNCEWSQELKVRQSFDEYVRAWVLVHALHRHLGLPGAAPGVVFNASVGYNLEGIRKDNVQWFLESVRDASALVARYLEVTARRCPATQGLSVPATMCDSVTLSTMHGCPPDEIEGITSYLLREKGFHTSVKLNPTLLGPERVRGIINGDLGYRDVVVPDEAFGHDLKWTDALPMLRRLQGVAAERSLVFGVKLTNTLEVENFRTIFPPREKMMYLSGRALHAVSANAAHALAEEFPAGLLMSFAGGADAFNVAPLLRGGLRTITVCSDILKSGGYLRLPQYLEETQAALAAARARDLADFVVRGALAPDAGAAADAPAAFPALLAEAGVAADGAPALAAHLRAQAGPASPLAAARAFAAGRGWPVDETAAAVLAAAGRANLRAYAAQVRGERLLKKDTFDTSRSKTHRRLGLFDCIEAPCTDECPVDQKVPVYMNLVREGRFSEAVAVTRADNPLPVMLGRVCDHLCEKTCIRTHYDEPLAIRELKRFVMSQETAAIPPSMAQAVPRADAPKVAVAVIGAGPCGQAAAWELLQRGFPVTLFEERPYAGGMVGGLIPTYRLPNDELTRDLDLLRKMGAELRYGQRAGRDFTLADLRAQGFGPIVVAVGAQQAKRLGLPGEDAQGVVDALTFLRRAKEGQPVPLGRRVGVIGAGDTAMDCARTAWRLAGEGAQVQVIYRRTIGEMPADREEVHQLLEEGIGVVELAAPKRLVIEDGRLSALVCQQMALGPRDASGRRSPVEVPGEELTIPLDTLIVAVSQHAVLDFFGDTPPTLTRSGYLQTDAETLATSLPGVYAGGDVSQHGPSSIVKAAGDGKRIARAIAAVTPPSSTPPARGPVDRTELLRRRSRREFRVALPHRGPAERRDFDEVALGLTPEAARAEAARCLDCDQICSLCVSVCPNLAFLTYESAPFAATLPTLVRENGGFRAEDGPTVRVGQQFQVAVLTDFCNECGNCATFCPTADAPYQKKPRLYLDRGELEAEADNAFQLFRRGAGPDAPWGIDARVGGATHTLVLEGGAVDYAAPGVSARFDAETFALVAATAAADLPAGARVDLAPVATMYVLLRGLAASAPFLPTAHRAV
jgi:putative selenate reductase